MILDKITFARLISCITDMIGRELDNEHIERINYVLIAGKDQSVIPNTTASATAVNELLRTIAIDEFIPTIKAYRTLTGLGLHESKRAIDKFRDDHAKNFKYVDQPVKA